MEVKLDGRLDSDRPLGAVTEELGNAPGVEGLLRAGLESSF